MSKFNKVSFERYKQDTSSTKEIYDNIKLPVRATKKSAGYDFFAPERILIPKGGYVNIPTGIKVELADNEFLMIVPRSGLGFKTGTKLANTVGIIDADYIESKNEGHIFVKLLNNSCLSNEDVVIEQGTAFCQGIIQKYYTTTDDCVERERNGGFGSTDK